VAIRAKFRQNDGPRAKPGHNATFSIARRLLHRRRGKDGHVRNSSMRKPRADQDIVLPTAIVHSRRSRDLDRADPVCQLCFGRPAEAAA
jgi:hypothetical protein